MIQAIREIGEYALKKEGKSVDNPIAILVDNPSNDKTKNILFLSLTIKNGYECIYNGIEMEEFTPTKLLKYLYRSGSANGTDLTPTIKTAKPDTIKNKFRKRILAWFNEYTKEKSNHKFFKSIGLCLKQNSQKIEIDLEKQCSPVSNIISLKINGKYLGDFEEFRNILLGKAKIDFYHRKSFSAGQRFSIAKNELCSVCNKNKAEIYGFVSTYNFYTVDKPGFVSGGFRQGDAWKNYPVCLECALVLEEGKKFIESNLQFSLYKTNYYLIPKFLGLASFNEKKRIFRIFENYENISKNETAKSILNDEEKILYFLSKFQNYLNLNFLFFHKNNSEFKILQYIEDILPSRLRKIFEVKKHVEKVNVFQDKRLFFNFGIFKDFFPFKKDPKTKKFVGYHIYYLEIIDKILSSKKIEYSFILNFIVKKIQSDFINQEFLLTINVLKGFMILLFLQKLNLIEISKGDKIMNENFFTGEGETSEKVEQFFAEFPQFFNDDSKRVVFLVGVLAQFLLNIQRLPEVSNAEPGKEPFRPMLKGLKLRRKEIISLLPLIQNKLEEYGKNYYRELEEKIAEYFVRAGEKWDLSNDEISFYFTLGMNLSKYFKSNKEENDGGESNGTN